MGDYIFGGNQTSTTTTSGGKTTSTSKAEVPSYFETPLKQALSRASGAADRPYEAYNPSDRVAGLHQDQQDSFGLTRANAGAWQPNLSRAGELANPTAQGMQFYDDALGGTSPNDWRRSMDTSTGSNRTINPDGSVSTTFEEFNQDNIKKYMDPYVSNVLDRSAEEYQRHRGIQRQGIEDDAFRAGAFGGSRHGVVESEFDRNTGQDLKDIYTTGTWVELNIISAVSNRFFTIAVK